MSRHTLYLSLLSIAIAGCTTINSKQAEGSFDYLSHKPGKTLQIPVELDPPQYVDDYAISQKANSTGLVGENLDIRSPALVLPIAEASRIVLKESTTTVWFDKVFEDKDLPELIHKGLTEVLKRENATVTKEDENTYVSDWFLKENIIDRLIFDDLDSVESMKFKYTYDVKPHRRSLALHVELIDYMKTDNEGGSKEIAPIDKKRAEVSMLNQVISQIDYDYRFEQQKQRLAKASKNLVVVGTNEKDEAAYIVEMDLDILWDSMTLFFGDYGFKITDLNENKFIYYVDFDEPELGIWDALWGPDVEAVDVKYAKYQFQLTRIDKKHSAVTLYDENGKALSMQTIERISPIMKKGLSFKNLF